MEFASGNGKNVVGKEKQEHNMRCQSFAVGCLIENSKSKLKKGHNFDNNKKKIFNCLH